MAPRIADRTRNAVNRPRGATPPAKKPDAKKPAVKKPADSFVGFSIPGTGIAVNFAGAKERFVRRAKAAGEFLGGVGTAVGKAAGQTAGDLKAAATNPVEAGKGFFLGAQNMWRDAFDAAGHVTSALANGGKLPIDPQYRSDQPRYQPKNRAQRGGKTAFDVVAGAVSYDPLAGGGKGGRALQPAAVTVGGQVVGTTPSRAVGQVLKSQARPVAGKSAPSATTIEKLAEAFRRAHKLGDIGDAHDGRHVLLGQTTTRKGETLVNAAENTVFKDLAGHPTVKAFVSRTGGIQGSFDAFYAKQQGLAAAAKKDGLLSITRFEKGELDFNQLKAAFAKNGIRDLRDPTLEKFEKAAEDFAFNPKAMGVFLRRQVKVHTAAPSRPEALAQYKAALRDLATLQTHNAHLTPSQILAAKSGVSYDVTAKELAAAHASIERQLATLK